MTACFSSCHGLQKTPKMTEISTLPLWVNLKNIPDCCYSCLGISHVASGLGEPILTHKPRLYPTTMGEAKVLVEMELDRYFLKTITFDDKQGSIFLVEVEYMWIPSMCERCGNLGHKEKRCLLTYKPKNLQQKETKDGCSDIHVVDIDVILQQRDSMTAKSPPNANPILQSCDRTIFPVSANLDHFGPTSKVVYELINNSDEECDFVIKDDLCLVTRENVSRRERSRFSPWRRSTQRDAERFAESSKRARETRRDHLRLIPSKRDHLRGEITEAPRRAKDTRIDSIERHHQLIPAGTGHRRFSRGEITVDFLERENTR
ncbi:hypothetical protein Bca4012_027153 [Brassica carinata]